MIKIKENVIFLMFLIALFLVHGTLNRRIQLKPINYNFQKYSINFKSEYTKFLNVGLNSFFSKFLWISTVLKLDTAHYKKKDLNSWLFLKLSTITDLDPYFYDAFLYGGQYLSIIKDDPFGAESIYKKGLKNFKDDFWLNLNTGYNAFFELNKKKEGIHYYTEALKNSDSIKYNSHLPFFLTAYFTSKNDNKAAIKILELSLKNTKDPKLKKALIKKINALRIKI
tara:strand:+ start:14008 stop:14682 length:675 start_codon:yes stop_codon:yes gene_type:complete